MLYVPWLYHTVPQALKLSTLWQPRHNSSRASSSPFRDGHGRCTGLCVRVLAIYGNEHIFSGEEQGCCEVGSAIPPHTYFLGVLKATAPPQLRSTAAAQQQCNSTSASSPGLRDSRGACVLTYVRAGSP